jgi:hypothetical protein
LVDLRSGVAVIPATQAIHLSSSSKITLKVTGTSVSTSSNIRGSFLSSNSTIRTTSREEINTNVRTTRHLAFLPQQPTKTTQHLQCKEEVVHVSAVGNKATGRIIAQRRQLSSRQLSTPQQDKDHHSKHQEDVVRPATVER